MAAHRGVCVGWVMAGLIEMCEEGSGSRARFLQTFK